jgi:hypothetical protein
MRKRINLDLDVPIIDYLTSLQSNPITQPNGLSSQQIPTHSKGTLEYCEQVRDLWITLGYTDINIREIDETIQMF